MHQLSSDHVLATGDSGTHAHGAALTSTAHGHGNPAVVHHLSDGGNGAAIDLMALSGETMSAGGANLISANLISAGVGVAAVEWAPMTPSGEGDGCAGCASHLMLMATCLLALVLVVGVWLLRSPTVRLLVRAKTRLLSVVVIGRARIRPALSLVELSLRRT